MKDFRFKIKCLFYAIKYAIEEWKEHVWDVELDEQVCCSGKSTVYPCGCQGVTYRQQVRWQYLGE